MWRRGWGFLKLAYLYLQYLMVGLEEENFQVAKGNYLMELQHYAAAARAFQRALRDTQSPYVHASLGYCYLNLGMPTEAVTSLKTAYAKVPCAEFAIVLAHALLDTGERQEGAELLAHLKRSLDTYPADLQAELTRLEERVSATATP
jgi:tetratricopeptide (TPR) repeat protein